MKTSLKAAGILCAAGSALWLASASAVPVTGLDFENIGDGVLIDDYYNGTGGPALDFGVQFVGAVALEDTDVAGSVSIVGNPTPTAVMGYTGTQAILNYATGFETPLEFFYSSTVTSYITLFGDLNATGTPLAFFSLSANHNANSCDTTNGAYCNWEFFSLIFDGIAKSILFTGGGSSQALFDQLSLNPVPLPAAVWLLGSALLGFAAVGRRRRQMI